MFLKEVIGGRATEWVAFFERISSKRICGSYLLFCKGVTLERVTFEGIGSFKRVRFEGVFCLERIRMQFLGIVAK